MAGEDENHDENANIPPPVPPTQQAPHTLSTIKLPILKKGEVLPPKTAEVILARERERKARTTLLMSIPEDHLAKFHKMNDVKEMWGAIKSRFGGNDESKKMQKYILKQQFKRFSASPLKMPIRSSLGLYLLPDPKVFEPDVKGSTGSSSSAHNVAFVSSSTSSTNDVSTAYGVSTSPGHNSQREGSSSYTDELMYSFFAKQSSGPKLDHVDLEQVDEFDLEEMDLNEYKQENFALMAYSNAGSYTEVTSCLKECEESYAKLKKLYDEQREQLGDASIEIQAYTQALKKVEAQLVCHQQNQLVYEEKIRFMKIDLDDKTNVLIYHKKLLAEAVKEKEELKTKLENFQSSSKGLSKLLNSQMSAKDKSGLGYGDQIHEGVLSYENEVLESVFDSRSSDVEDSPVYDRFAKVEGMHAVPPPMTGIYMPPKSDFGIDESKFTYGPKQSKTSESDAKTSDFASCESNSSVETLESVPKPVVNEPKVVSKPKVWSDAPIIEEYESDSDDEYVIKPSKEQEKPSFAFVNIVKHLGLGYGFTRKACFVCGGFGHLIRDCDFHEKRMAKQIELNKQKGKGTGQRENRLVWNNVQRLNHQNKFVPKAALTKTGRFLVNAARQNLSSQAATTSTARKGAIGKLLLRPQQVVIGDPKDITGTKSPNTIVDQTLVKMLILKIHYADPSQQWLGHITGNKAYLVEYQDYNGGPVAFGGSKGQITGKGKIITGKLDFEDVYFVKELKQFNLFSVSQMCDKKNKVLFTDSECLVLSPDFKLPDENQVLLRVPRQNNMYSFNLENIVPTGGLACLIAKATVDESNKWHRRLGHVNFKNLNKLVKGNLVRGLPSKIFQNDHTCVACQKGKQHKASCKAKVVSSISQPLQLLHMDLFGPTSVRSINHKTYCLVITDDFSRFSWVFFLRTKDETSGILKDFIRQIENQLNQKVKTIRCDNGTKFKNRDIIELCGSKGIKREYSNGRTPQQNRVAERKNRTLIEAARIMLADSFLPNTFWAEAVRTACYVLNRFLEELERNKRQEKEANDAAEALRKEFAQEAEDLLIQAGAARSTNDSQIPALDDIYDNPSDGIFTNASYDDEGAVADFTNLESTVNVSHIPTSRIHSIHPTTQILRDPKSVVQTKSKVHKSSGAHAFVSYIQKQRRNNHNDFQHCLFSCFLSQIEPKKISEAFEDERL
ncbi:putative ribonuclease H-like domain-containing protein [Tanacetum coccineum]